MVLVLMLLVLSAWPSSLQAQVTAAISGRVEDSSGGGVSDAKITVKNLETGATRGHHQAILRGDYQISALPLGPQEVPRRKARLQIRCAHGRHVGGESKPP